MKKRLAFLAAFSMTLFALNVYADSGCCCTSCICPSAPQGAVGNQGPAGTQGLPGDQGSIGGQGGVGPQGPVGLQGSIGPQGPCCSTPTIVKSQANVYSVLDQSILPGQAALFQNTNAIVAADYDISQMGTTGQITFLKTGIYSIAWSVEGQLTPPFPSPVPAWAFSLYLDGVPIPGSCFSIFSLFPAQATKSPLGGVIVAVSAGQVLTLQSSSTLPVSLISTMPGSILPETSVSLVIKEK